MSDSKKILVVEDDRPMAKAMEIKLKNEGFQTTVVNNGEDAISTIKTGSFDLVLLDLIMPKVDGFKVLEELNTLGIDKPKIVVSSNLSQSEDFQRAKDLGACGYYVKSDTPLSKIIDIINQHTS